MTRRLACLLLLWVLGVSGCSAQSGAPSPSGTPAASSSGSGSPAAPSSGSGSTFTNPVLGQGADPFLTVRDGTYFYVQAASDGHGVTLRSSKSLATLQFAPEQRIVDAGGKAPCCEYWAPEVHQLGKRFYVYVAADDGDNNHHRMYVFSAPKITGPYAFAGQLKLPGDRWAIDATVLPGHGGPYVLWSGWPGARNGEQDVYLAKLASPTEATGQALRLSRPQYAWEEHAGTVGVHVNEAPAVLEHGGTIYVTYSASGCWTPDYALGLLSAKGTSDLLDPASWHKAKQPVFEGGASSGLYGTGHNGFFASPDGSQTWLVYHAVTTSAGSCGGDREVYAQPLTFGADGAPRFGAPDKPSTALPLPAGDPGS